MVSAVSVTIDAIAIIILNHICHEAQLPCEPSLQTDDPCSTELDGYKLT